MIVGRSKMIFILIKIIKAFFSPPQTTTVDGEWKISAVSGAIGLVFVNQTHWSQADWMSAYSLLCLVVCFSKENV